MKMKFSSILEEYSFRMDFEYHSIFSSIDINQASHHNSFVSLSQLIDVVRTGSVKLDNIEEDSFFYIEIGDLKSDGIVFPQEIKKNDTVLDDNLGDLSYDSESSKYQEVVKKIKKGDIIKPRINDILISKVRPKLKKILFMDFEKSTYYYTKAFIVLRVKNNIPISPRVIYYMIRYMMNKEIVAISRIGKSGYPTISHDDLKFLKIDKILIDKISKNHEEILKKFTHIENEIHNFTMKKENKEKELFSLAEKIFSRTS